MFHFIFKTGTYYLVWQKFRKQFVTLLISMASIVVILSVFNDALAILNKDTFWLALLFKWFLILLIVGVNIYIFKTIKSPKAKKVSVKKSITKIEEYVKQKETLLSTTDVILAKYSKENL